MKWLRENSRFAIHGLIALIRNETSFRIETIIAVIVVVAGFVFQVNQLEWIAVILAIGFVLAAEAFNTSLEDLADAVHPEKHPLVGRAKDVAAGAVVIASIAAAVIGFIVFLPKVIACLRP